MKWTATLALMVLFGAGGVFAQDWPQWRGSNRDAKAADFKAPKTWPMELTQKWKVTVGEGVATPALVGDKLYVFSRQDGNEITRCLSVADGKELWSEKYESLGASGPAQGFSGPRCSPAVTGGKLVTVGVRGMISCLDASDGKKNWRKDDFKAWPGFFPSSSPMIVDGLVIAQLGGRDNGALVAYDLATGNEKWKWSGPSPAYASPALMTVGGVKLILAHTESKLVAVNAADGKLAWESAAAPQGEGRQGGPGGAAGAGGDGSGRGRGMGGGRDYKAATPIVDGQTIIIAGRGVKAVKLEKDGDKFVDKELWNNADKTLSFNTPALKSGLVYGLTGNNELFCLNAKDGALAWSAPFPSTAPAEGPRAALERALSISPNAVFGQAAPATPAEPGQAERPRRPGGQGGPGGPGGPGGRRGGGGGGGYGSIVDAGPVLLALTPGSQLIVFEPNGKEFKQLASYKVAAGQTHAYPIASGNRIFIKDKDSVTLWTVE
jgi:outer membrane protein assembly factor BamB